MERSNGGAIAIIIKHNSLLIDLRKLKVGRLWEIPGGSIENGESPEEALKREVKEEVDLDVQKITLLGIKNQAVHWINSGTDYFFLVNSFSGQPRALDLKDKETLDTRWIKISEIKNLLNVSWRIVDAIYFLSLHFPVFRGEYSRIRNAFDNRSVYSFEQFSGTSKANYPFFRYKNYLDKKIVGKITAIINDLKPPILQVNPGYGELTRELIKKYGKIDAIELSPEIKGKLKTQFGDKIRFINGIPEKFSSDKKYNSIIAVNSFIFQPSYLLFAQSIVSTLNKGGKLVFSPLELKYHIWPSSYIAYGHSHRKAENYQKFFEEFGFKLINMNTVVIDLFNGIKSNLLTFTR